jgi:hypothetical protein
VVPRTKFILCWLTMPCLGTLLWAMWRLKGPLEPLQVVMLSVAAIGWVAFGVLGIVTEILLRRERQAAHVHHTEPAGEGRSGMYPPCQEDESRGGPLG